MSSFNKFGTGFGCGLGNDFKCSSSLSGKGFYPLGLEPKRTIFQPKKTFSTPQIAPWNDFPRKNWTPSVLWGCDDFKSEAPKVSRGIRNNNPFNIRDLLWGCDDIKSEAPKVPRGIRNNNPGNIRDFGIPWEGLAGKDNADFCKFKSAHHGLRALSRDMITKIGNGVNTVDKIISKHAPPNENDTSSYIKHVARIVSNGDRHKVLKADDSTLALLVKTIVKHENGKMPYSDAEINAAVRDAKKK